LVLQEENIDLEELEQFAKTFKRRRIELGMKFPKIYEENNKMPIYNYPMGIWMTVQITVPRYMYRG
jgi:hypothetical protein